jgi:type IX secretion system substrate protein
LDSLFADSRSWNFNLSGTAVQNIGSQECDDLCDIEQCQNNGEVTVLINGNQEAYVDPEPCENGQYIWSTGGTEPYEPYYPTANVTEYGVTITCPNGCVYTGSYRVSESLVEGDPPGQGDIAVFPNPAYESVTIVFESTVDAPSRIALFDIGGRAIITEVLETRTGKNMVRWDISDMVAGVYIIHIDHPMRYKPAKLVIVTDNSFGQDK